MKSIKPGRGPSMLSGLLGVFVICFGIFWTIMASQFGGFFWIFGLFFTGIAVVVTIYNFKNATAKNRYSAVDIVEGEEEPDPLNERFGEKEVEEQEPQSGETESNFCPYCGTAVKTEYEYCHQCGKKLPE